MKRGLISLLCFVLLVGLTGCGSTAGAAGKTGPQTQNVNDVLEAGMAQEDEDSSIAEESESAPGSSEVPVEEEKEETSVSEEPGEETPEETPMESSGAYDVDLTVLSSTMVYSEVYNMLVDPDEYIGKTVKMNGAFSYFHDENADKYYFACIIQDATACCAQGMEFELAGDPTFPDDYPEVGEEITVVGIYDTYQEGELVFCTLRDAEFVGS
ncbi:MAG: hypothetical protein K6A77_01130 [Clostridiales bacterium]|nr:hypothetical protein [Clostridiales bacterium]